MKLHIRWMIRRDMPRVLEIESRCYRHPWDEEEFLAWLQKRTVVGMTLDDTEEDVTCGFMLYELNKHFIEILDLAVDPQWQRRGLATKSVERLYARLSDHRRSRLKVQVRESNLGAQLFLRSCGFMATEITRAGKNGCDEGGYTFELFTDGTDVLPVRKQRKESVK